MKFKDLYLDELNRVNYNVYVSKKNIWKSYVLTTFLGFAGAHWFYLDRKRLAISRLSLSVLTVLLIVAGLFIPTSQENLVSLLIAISLTTSMLWTVLDLFLIKQTIEDIDGNNEDLFIDEALVSRKI